MTADHNADASAFRDELSRLNEFTENTQPYLTPTNLLGEVVAVATVEVADGPPGLEHHMVGRLRAGLGRRHRSLQVRWDPSRGTGQKCWAGEGVSKGGALGLLPILGWICGRLRRCAIVPLRRLTWLAGFAAPGGREEQRRFR